ncbi:MAG: hypothetical protein ABI382_03270 [Nakamurella sp.]
MDAVLLPASGIRPSAPQSAWEIVAHAVVVTEDMAEAALTSLENSRVQYGAAHYAAAERIVTLALELSRPDLSLRARLILATIEFRQGDVIAAAAQAKDILTAAEALGEAYVMARSHFLLCSAHHSLGDSPSSRINGIRSVELLPDDAPLSVRIDHLRALGTAYGPGPDSERCHAQALDLINVIGDAARAIGVHNSLAYFAYQQDDFRRAAEHADQMLELSYIRHIPLVASQLDTIARILMMTGRREAAIELLRPLIPHPGDPTCAGGIEDLDPKPYGLAECMLTVAEAHRALGRYATARQALASTFLLVDEHHVGLCRAHARLAQAALFGDVGDFRGAYFEHIAFHAAVPDRNRCRAIRTDFGCYCRRRFLQTHQRRAISRSR